MNYVNYINIHLGKFGTTNVFLYYYAHILTTTVTGG